MTNEELIKELSGKTVLEINFKSLTDKKTTGLNFVFKESLSFFLVEIIDCFPIITQHPICFHSKL